MNPRRRDVHDRVAALAHADAHEGLTDQQAAERHGDGRSRRSYARYRHEAGHPAQQAFQTYLFGTPPEHRYRLAAWAMTSAKQLTIEKKTDDELLRDWLDLLRWEIDKEGEDRKTYLDPDASVLDWARSSEADGAIELEKAAHEREIASRGLDDRARAMLGQKTRGH